MRAFLFLSALILILPTGRAAAQSDDTALDCFDPKNIGQSAICGSERLFNLDKALSELKSPPIRRKDIIKSCNGEGEPSLRANDLWRSSKCIWEAYNTALDQKPPPLGRSDIVHPVCIDSLLPSMDNPDGGPGQSIDLATCQAGSRHLPFDQPDIKGEMFFHFDRWGPDNYSGGWIGYSQIGRIGTNALLKIFDNGGGTGTFSLLALVSGMPEGKIPDSPGNKLKLVHLWPFGDRCNGGLGSAKITGAGKIIAEAHVTTSDLLWNAPQTLGDQWRPPEGIAYSAANCIGTVQYKINPHSTDAPYVFVQARVEKIDDGDWTLETFPLQSCVNELLIKTLKHVPGTLTLKQLGDLADQVTDQCR